jgi:O-antigen/teichoic acid export membrane protein
VSVISLLGLDSATLRFLPKSLADGRKPEARSFIKLILSLSLAAGIFFSLILFISRNYIAIEYYKNIDIASPLLMFAIAIPAFTLTSILVSLLQSFQDVRKRMAIKYISEPIVKFTITALLFWVGWKLEAAMTGIVLAMWCSVILGGLALYRHMHKVSGGEKMPSGERLAPVLKFALPLVLGIFFNVAATRADILMIGSMINTEQAGIYAAAFQSAAILGLILFSVEQVIAPMLAEMLSGGKKRAKEIYALSLRWPMMLGMPLFTIFVIMAPELMGVFGPSFHQAVPCFVILLVGQMVALVTGSSNYILLVSGYSKIVMLNELIGATILFVLNFLLIPRLGIIGAAVAVASNLAFINILRVLQVQYFLKLHPYEKTLWKPALAGAAVFIAAFILRSNIRAEYVLWLIPFTVMLYVSLTILMGVQPSDKKAIAGILKRLFPRALGTVV